MTHKFNGCAQVCVILADHDPQVARMYSGVCGADWVMTHKFNGCSQVCVVLTGS